MGPTLPISIVELPHSSILLFGASVAFGLMQALPSVGQAVRIERGGFVPTSCRPAAQPEHHDLARSGTLSKAASRPHVRKTEDGRLRRRISLDHRASIADAWDNPAQSIL